MGWVVFPTKLNEQRESFGVRKANLQTLSLYTQARHACGFEYFLLFFIKVFYIFVSIFHREESTAYFETWCNAGSMFGCYEDAALLSSFGKVDLFNGSIPVDPGTDMCLVHEVPDQYTYNEWFGGSGEKDSDAPHPLKETTYTQYGL